MEELNMNMEGGVGNVCFICTEANGVVEMRRSGSSVLNWGKILVSLGLLEGEEEGVEEEDLSILQYLSICGTCENGLMQLIQLKEQLDKGIQEIKEMVRRTQPKFSRCWSSRDLKMSKFRRKLIRGGEDADEVGDVPYLDPSPASQGHGQVQMEDQMMQVQVLTSDSIVDSTTIFHDIITFNGDGGKPGGVEEDKEVEEDGDIPSDSSTIPEEIQEESPPKKRKKESKNNREVGAVRSVPQKKSENKQIKCTLCDRVFGHRNSLIYHMKGHTGERPCQCEQCGKSFFATSALKVHMRLHSGEKPYTCEHCGRKFRQWGDLKYHVISIHSDIRQYQCEFCGKNFARKYSLIVHRRIHTGEKNYKCDFCDKTFRAASYLQNHRRIHTGEKPYCCTICGKPFRVRSDMKRHMTSHTRGPVPETQDFNNKTEEEEEGEEGMEDVITFKDEEIIEDQSSSAPSVINSITSKGAIGQIIDNSSGSPLPVMSSSVVSGPGGSLQSALIAAGDADCLPTHVPSNGSIHQAVSANGQPQVVLLQLYNVVRL